MGDSHLISGKVFWMNFYCFSNASILGSRFISLICLTYYFCYHGLQGPENLRPAYQTSNAGRYTFYPLHRVLSHILNNLCLGFQNNKIHYITQSSSSNIIGILVNIGLHSVLFNSYLWLLIALPVKLDLVLPIPHLSSVKLCSKKVQ